MIVMLKEFFFDSCGAGRIHVCRWEPKAAVCGIVQIVHGIAEYAQRYDAFANYLNEQGYLVVAEDHMGHGKSIDEPRNTGYFTGGWFSAVDDTCKLMKMTMEEYPKVPYILFGHSMGSFMVRTILAKHPDCGISGAVICGTGWQPTPVLKTGIGLAKSICKMGDSRRTSAVLQKLMFGSYNRKVEHPRTAYDWLTRVDQTVDAYVADPLCGFTPTAGLARDMLLGIEYIQKQENLQKMDKTLPVLFVAGGDDPVGNYGEGVRKTARMFKNVGMENVTTQIYPLCRHEILNELNKNDIYQDIGNWIQKIIGTK